MISVPGVPGMLQLAKSLWSDLIPLIMTLITMQEAEPSEPRGAEVTKKPKVAVPFANKRPKKETKKKR